MITASAIRYGFLYCSHGKAFPGVHETSIKENVAYWIQIQVADSMELKTRIAIQRKEDFKYINPARKIKHRSTIDDTSFPGSIEDNTLATFPLDGNGEPPEFIGLPVPRNKENEKGGPEKEAEENPETYPEGDLDKDSEQDPEVINTDKVGVTCVQCRRENLSIRSISRHMEQYCPRKPAYIGETYQCEICERDGFKSKSDLKRHQQSTSVRKNSCLGRRMRHQQPESSDMTGLMDCHAQVLNQTLINPSNDVASRVMSVLCCVKMLLRLSCSL
jgi:hypothetical protein